MTTPYAKYTLQLNVEKDADVIAYLNAQANKNDTIRRALRTQAWSDQEYTLQREEIAKGLVSPDSLRGHDERTRLTTDDLEWEDHR